MALCNINTVPKRKITDTQAGNNFKHTFHLRIKDAQEITQVNIPVESWMIDFQYEINQLLDGYGGFDWVVGSISDIQQNKAHHTLGVNASLMICKPCSTDWSR